MLLSLCVALTCFNWTWWLFIQSLESTCVSITFYITANCRCAMLIFFLSFCSVDIEETVNELRARTCEHFSINVSFRFDWLNECCCFFLFQKNDRMNRKAKKRGRTHTMLLSVTQTVTKCNGMKYVYTTHKVQISWLPINF